MPAIAVIIPTFNRPESLRSCLHSLQNQKLDASLWEVIVVNDGGSAIEHLILDFGGNFRCFNQENSGPAKARNLGASMTDAPIITFIDDDCRAHPEWLDNIFASSIEGQLTGGKVINSYSENLYSEGSQMLIDFLYRYQKNSDDQFFTSNNFSLFKSDFNRFNGFDCTFHTSAGEDREFCVRLKKNGMKLEFNSQIIVEHDHFLTLNKFIKLHKKYGRAAISYRKSAINQEINISKNPKIGFYVNLFSYPFELQAISYRRKIALSLILALSQFCVAWGYLKAKK
jgi:glycosyltransferase involved in cell wall biosynthesis